MTRITEMLDGQFRVMVHGTTMHGAMRIRNADGSPAKGLPVPTTYYSFDGPMGEAISAVRVREGSLSHVAVIGLGTGALACHIRRGESVSFFEIDPVVAHLARDPSKFRFLTDCAPDAPIVLGDARLTLSQQAHLSDVIVVDAFSSDAIPVHLLTVQAMQVYLSRLAEHGVIVLHISNNMMEFSGIATRVAAELGLVTLVRTELEVSPDNPDLRSPSEVAVIARSTEDFGSLTRAGSGWRQMEPTRSARAWTDDYSTILTAIAAKWWH